MTKRRIRRRTCENKIRHISAADAHAARAAMGPEGTALRVYACRFCGNWHLGHPPYNSRAKPLGRRWLFGRA